jgi:putative transposase
MTTTQRTVKLKVSIIGDQKGEDWNIIRDFSYWTWKASNLIVSGQYNNDFWLQKHIEHHGKDFAFKSIQKPREIPDGISLELKNEIEKHNKILLDENKIVGKRNEEIKENYEKAREAFKNEFGVSSISTTERDIKHHFPNLPSCISNTLNNEVVTNYSMDKSKVSNGDRSLRNYKKGRPIPIRTPAFDFKKVESESRDHIDIEFKPNGVYGKKVITFRIFFGKDKQNNFLTMEKIISGEIKLASVCSLQIIKKELFFYLVVNEKVKEIVLDENLVVGVDLGIATPVYCALSKGKQRLSIGSASEFFETRLQMQRRKRKIHQSLTRVRSQHGRKRKTKKIDALGKLERNFCHTYNHSLSRKIVDFAIKNGAGTIKLENLEGIGDSISETVLKNWSYYELQQMIEFKSKKTGIKVMYINPRYTSQTCSSCGNLEDGQRISQSEFECKSCGEKMHADYNAALNISKSLAVVK